MTMESLPPENSSTGRSNSAATSRMMWMASASSALQVAEFVAAGAGLSSCAVVITSSLSW